MLCGFFLSPDLRDPPWYVREKHQLSGQLKSRQVHIGARRHWMDARKNIVSLDMCFNIVVCEDWFQTFLHKQKLSKRMHCIQQFITIDLREPLVCFSITPMKCVGSEVQIQSRSQCGTKVTRRSHNDDQTPPFIHSSFLITKKHKWCNKFT